jgi:hypothetical protein
MKLAGCPDIAMPSLLSLLFFTTSIGFARKKSLDCSALKKGSCYTYPLNSRYVYACKLANWLVRLCQLTRIFRSSFSNFEN